MVFVPSNIGTESSTLTPQMTVVLILAGISPIQAILIRLICKNHANWPAIGFVKILTS